MRDMYFAVYHTIVYKQFFYISHQQRSEMLLFWARLVCAAVSIVSVLIWSIARTMPALWACLIALAQMAQMLINSIPWAKQLSALTYLIPALDDLIVDMAADWRRLGYAEEDDENALREKASEYERRYYELEHRYVNGVWFPRPQQLIAETETQCDNYFAVMYSSSEGGETDETPTEAG